jgi:response regulator RpfG family c-di-GMP phosphodiesterase
MVALLVGRAAGFRQAFLQDLGLAALVHDAGYAGLPTDTAAGPEGLMRHPAEGARIMLRQRGFHPAKLRRLRAVLDHHRDYVEPRGRPSALGQVLRLAEDYATLIRVYASRISPADALGAMAAAAGRTYNPALTQVMVNALGRYPPGTLLELEDGRYARSVAPVRSPETFAAPLVRIYDLKTRALSAERHDLALEGAIRRALPG